MDVHCIYFLCIILCNNLHHSIGETGNSCKNMFQYQLEGNEWVGLVEIQASSWNETFKLEVILSLPGQSPSQYVGSIESYRTLKETIEKIASNQLAQFRIRFPIQNPLPKLQQIIINGQALCTELPVELPSSRTLCDKVSYNTHGVKFYISNHETGSLTTVIRLQYTLFTKQADMKQYHAIEQRYPMQPQLQYTETNPTSLSETAICGSQHEKYTSKILPLHSSKSNTITRGAWPWLVTIYLNEKTGVKHHCEGSLISERTVVTAASCFRMANRTLQANEIVLFLGRHNISDWMESGSKIGIAEELVIHKDFMTVEASRDADIALVIMRERIEFTEFIRPICLYNGKDTLSSVVNQRGTVVGWVSGEIITSAPIKLSIPIVSSTECLRSNPLYRYITSQRTFCAGARDGRGTCDTDRGTGMMFQINNKWMLRGIFSFALNDPLTNTCNLSEYVVFTDAAKFFGWITTLMR